MTSFIGNHGLVAIFLLMMVAAVLPAASELTMIYAGALASGSLAGEIALSGHRFAPGWHAYLAVVVTGVVANTIGAMIGWAIGFRGGHPLLARYGHYAHITPQRIARAERWFERFEGVAVPLGFATPVVRSFVAIPAGILELSLRRFVPVAVLGIAAFCAAIAGIGWAVGSSWHSARHDLQYVDYAVAAGIVILAASWIIHRRRSITMAARGSDSTR